MRQATNPTTNVDSNKDQRDYEKDKTKQSHECGVSSNENGTDWQAET
jgi:hypothetical protein